MTRRAYFYFQNKGASIPNAIVAVECVGDVYPDPSRHVIEHERLERWEACSAVKGASGYEQARQYSGAAAVSFWSHLYSLCKKRGSVWVITSNATRTWPLLSMWDIIENREILISGTPLKDDAASSVGGGVDGIELLLLEEPVNAVKLRFPDLPGRITFVDARNYGVDLSDRNQDASGMVSRGYMLLAGMAEGLQEGGLGSLQVTAASQAMYTYRKRFLRHTLLVHNNDAALNLEEASYHGGRCEAFRIGYTEDTVCHLDYSSLYASICATETVPCRLRGIQLGGETIQRDHLGDDVKRIASVRVKTTLNCLPWRRAELTYYPVGEFDTVLCEPELRFAEVNKMVVEYYQTAWYDCEPALAEYANYWLEKRAQFRKNQMHDMESWAKRLLNCLPGKFGQRGRTWEYVSDKIADHPYDSWTRANEDGTYSRYRAIAWNVQREVESQWSNGAIPSISSYICSSARVKLWNAMMICGLENVLYVDTDAIICNYMGYDRLTRAPTLVGRQPGQLRLLWTGSGCEIRGWKDYTCGTNTVRAGIPRGQVSDAAPSGFVWCRAGIYTSLKSHKTPIASRQLISCSRRNKYRHGHVEESGVVRPFAIPEESYLCK